MTIFIERHFELDTGETVVLRFLSPEPASIDWQCEMQLDWPDRQRRLQFFGIDGVQALVCAIQGAQSELEHSPESLAGRLTWLGGKHLGLPFPLAP